MSSILVRQEIPEDYHAVSELIQAAFENDPHGDHTEHLLVARLRNSESFIPELSLVALYDMRIAGHILLTVIQIESGKQIWETLALAPVSVHPNYQRRGLGKALIGQAHRVAKELGYGSIVLVGHATYYPRFGYQKAADFGIRFPFETPDENCMVVELAPGALKGVSGMVRYPDIFFG